MWSLTLAVALGLFVFWPMAQGDAVAASQIVVAYNALGFLGGVGAMCACLRMSPLTVLRSLAPSTVAAGFGLAVASLAVYLTGEDWVVLLAKLALFLLAFLPAAGILLGGKASSLLHKAGWKSLLRQS
jgi:hypothetical protein